MIGDSGRALPQNCDIKIAKSSCTLRTNHKARGRKTKHWLKLDPAIFLMQVSHKPSGGCGPRTHSGSSLPQNQFKCAQMRTTFPLNIADERQRFRKSCVDQSIVQPRITHFPSSHSRGGGYGPRRIHSIFSVICGF